MRSSKSRSRNKSNRQRTLGNVVNRVFDSSGPEGKVRGTPQQIIEKYLALARDAQLSNDRVAEQSFLQHAEHYTRMLGEAQKEMAERQQFHQPRQDGDDPREGQPNGHGGHQPRESARDDNGREDNRREDGRREDNRRDDSRRDDNRRDDNRRDDNRRETSRRENTFRDAQRDQPRDQGGRDASFRDTQGERGRTRPEPVAEPLVEPVSETAPVAQPQPPRADEPALVPVAQPAELPESSGLPDALTTSEDDTAGPVETPEAVAKPVRSRAPRAPRSDKTSDAPAPRTRRRKPAPEGEARPEDAPAARDE